MSQLPNGNICEGEKTREWRPPNDVQRCTYLPGMKLADSPHSHKLYSASRPKVCNNILDAIGNTPLVRCSNISKSYGLKCEVLAKCDYLNPGGSVKDRIGVRMVEDAEKAGWLRPGDTIIEPTSGNTGIGLALAAAVRGYRCIIVMPEKMSKEKVDVLRALGAEIVRTPTAASFDSAESHIGVAKRLQQTIPRSHILDQYTNASNPLAHYDQTAEEIIDACEGRIDLIAITAGTGGTLTGLARKIHEKCPSCKIVGVDPDGSILAQPEELNKNGIHFYEVEGIGYDFEVTTCDRRFVDRWYKSFDKESFLCARRLMREEGFLCGGSSGSAFSCAVQAIKDFGFADDPSKRCVVLLPDGVRNYMTKFLSDEWMIARDFLEIEPVPDESRAWWWFLPVSVLKLPPAKVLESTATIQEALDTMHANGFDQMPVVDGGHVLGVATTSHLLTSMLLKGRVRKEDPVSKALFTQYRRILPTTPLGKISKLLEIDAFVLLMQASYAPANPSSEEVLAVVTSIDLIRYISENVPTGTLAISK